MPANNTELGRCPRCDGGVPADELLIEYESGCGRRIVVARCPACVAVVTLTWS